MIIAYDGGAFQQGIHGGIFNVSVGFLNAVHKLDQKIKFLLVADPGFGQIKNEAIDQLNFTPEVLYRNVLKQTGNHILYTNNPRPYFEVDGRAYPAVISPDGDCVVYEYNGKRPKNSMFICSRSSRPIDTINLPDTRALGVAVSRIEIRDGGDATTMFFDDSRLGDGFHDVEREWRWTRGRARIPVETFNDGYTISVKVFVKNVMRYRLFNGRHSAVLENVLDNLAEWYRGKRLNNLANELQLRGCGIYIANHFLPVIIPGIRTYTWAHDIIPVLYPNYFGSDALKNFDEVLNVFRNAEHIFCNSNVTRKDIIQNLTISESRVSTTWIGGNEVSRQSEIEIKNVLDRFGIAKDFILSVGTIEPRKNHTRLVMAYKKILESRAVVPELVIVGAHGWGFSELERELRDEKFAGKVRILGGVNNRELGALYSGAQFLCYPSVYEGFGMPVLEAMQCGTPVLTSAETSMAEIASGAALLVDPLSVESIYSGLVQMLDDGMLRERLATRASKFLDRYKWETVASTVLSKIGEKGK